MKHHGIIEHNEGNTSFNYLEPMLKMAGDSAYVLSISKSNLSAEGIISKLKGKFGKDSSVIGILPLADIIAVILKKDESKAQEISDSIYNLTGKYVGRFECDSKKNTMKLYSALSQAAQTAEKEQKNNRLYDPAKDSLEGQLGVF